MQPFAGSERFELRTAKPDPKKPCMHGGQLPTDLSSFTLRIEGSPFRLEPERGNPVKQTLQISFRRLRSSVDGYFFFPAAGLAATAGAFFCRELLALACFCVDTF